MWNLYYNPLGEIVHLSQQTLATDLAVLAVPKDLAENFIQGTLRYSDYLVNGSELVKKQDVRDALWTVNKFVAQTSSSDSVDVDFWLQDGQLHGQCNSDIEPTKFWITHYNNPIGFIGTMILPVDTRFIVPNDVKISIFAEKNLVTFRLHENQPSRH